MANKIIWQAQPKQAAFLRRKEYEVLYGGAAGGGKSDAMLMEALRQINIPNYRGIIFRSTYPQLEALISRSREIYPLAAPGARYNRSDKRWLFPSGACVFFGYMQRDDDRYNYQGKPYDFVGFDELTQFTEVQYKYLMSRNRPTGPNTRVYMRATANPGGKGHAWVKARFIDVAPPMTPIIDKVSITDPDGKTLNMERTRIYIPATVFDNKRLLANDPGYLANLGMLPDAERDALLYGKWDSFSGQVFREWRNNPNPAGTWTHVIEPFSVPKNWSIMRSMDWGYSRPYSVHWYTMDQYGRIYCIRELYGCTGTANEGVKETPFEVAAKIRQIEDTDPNIKGRKVTGVADPAIFSRDHGDSIADQMAVHPYYVVFSPADHTRIAGKMQCHYRLAFDDDGLPMFQVFNTCKHFIRTIPTLVYSEKDVEDIDTDLEDHIYDEWRYMMMEHLIKPRRNADKLALPYGDPLNMFNDRR